MANSGKRDTWTAVVYIDNPDSDIAEDVTANHVRAYVANSVKEARRMFVTDAHFITRLLIWNADPGTLPFVADGNEESKYNVEQYIDLLQQMRAVIKQSFDFSSPAFGGPNAGEQEFIDLATTDIGWDLLKWSPQEYGGKGSAFFTFLNMKELLAGDKDYSL